MSVLINSCQPGDDVSRGWFHRITTSVSSPAMLHLVDIGTLSPTKDDRVNDTQNFGSVQPMGRRLGYVIVRAQHH
jgi:hypothetical protein